MLVVNLHTLQTVHVLYLVHDILLHCRRTFNGQNVGRRSGTVRQRSTSTYIVVLLYQNLFGQRHEILLHFTQLGSDDNLTVTAFQFTHRDFTVDFRNHCGIGRITRFEQLRHTRKTSRDVAGFTYGTRNLHQYVSGFDNLIVLNSQVSADGEVIRTNQLSVLVQDMSRRNLRPVF